MFFCCFVLFGRTWNTVCFIYKRIQHIWHCSIPNFNIQKYRIVYERLTLDTRYFKFVQIFQLLKAITHCVDSWISLHTNNSNKEALVQHIQLFVWKPGGSYYWFAIFAIELAHTEKKISCKLFCFVLFVCKKWRVKNWFKLQIKMVTDCKLPEMVEGSWRANSRQHFCCLFGKSSCASHVVFLFYFFFACVCVCRNERWNCVKCSKSSKLIKSMRSTCIRRTFFTTNFFHISFWLIVWW